MLTCVRIECRLLLDIIAIVVFCFYISVFCFRDCVSNAHTHQTARHAPPAPTFTCRIGHWCLWCAQTGTSVFIGALKGRCVQPTLEHSQVAEHSKTDSTSFSALPLSEVNPLSSWLSVASFGRLVLFGVQTDPAVYCAAITWFVKTGILPTVGARQFRCCRRVGHITVRQENVECDDDHPASTQALRVHESTTSVARPASVVHRIAESRRYEDALSAGGHTRGGWRHLQGFTSWTRWRSFYYITIMFSYNYL